MFFRFQLGLALARQQQRRQQQNQHGSAAHQPEHDRTGQQFGEQARFVFDRGRGFHRGGDHGRRWRRDGLWRRGGRRRFRRWGQLGVDRGGRGLGSRCGRGCRFGRHRCRCCSRRRSTRRFQLGQLIVLELNQLLQFVQLALQVGHAAFQLGIVATGSVQVFLGLGQACLTVTRPALSILAIGGHQAELVARLSLRRSVAGTGATGGVQLLGARPQAAAFTPGGVLAGHFGNRRALAQGRGLLAVGQAQHLAGLEPVDVAVDERVRIQGLDGQHGLLHRGTIVRVLLGNVPQGVALAGGELALLARGWRGHRRRGRRL